VVRCYGKFSRWGAVTGAVAVALAAVARAAGPLNSPAPLAAAPAAVSPADATVSVGAAQRAHDLGMSSLAAALYREILTRPALSEAERTGINLALAGALLDGGDALEAQKILNAMPEPHDAGWHLRAGLSALQGRQRDTAQKEWDAVNTDELSAADHAWYWFLGGALWDLVPGTRDGAAVAKANEFYNKAEAAATTELARARFKVQEERVRIEFLAPTPPDRLDEARRNYEQYQGKPVGYGFAENYAMMLDQSGRGRDAVQVLRQVLLTLPIQERGWRDEFNFLLGVIDNQGRGAAGRAALIQLLESGATAEHLDDKQLSRQREALILLFEASRTEPQRTQFQTELDKLISATPRHPILDALKFFRAELALAEKDYAQAEKHATDVLEQFPGSSLRARAFDVLIESGWEQQRYHFAAAKAALAHAEPGSPATRGELRVVEAEAWFRAGQAAEATGATGANDYRSAADAYAAVLAELPPGLDATTHSALIFQRILAEIKSGSGDAAKVLDQLAAGPAFALADRWQAEWNLARAMQARGAASDAFVRVSRLLASTGADAAKLAPELRARMKWLQARVAFEAGQNEAALTLGDAILANPESIAKPLQDEIASTTVLLKARALFALRRDNDALATLQKLRTDFPKADATVYSYLIEAAHYAEQEKIQDAQILLTKLVGNPDYATSEYVPWALYQLALLSERLGQPKNLEDAEKRIEDLVKHPAAGDLVFAARLEQGDLLRKLNQLPQAQQVYEMIVTTFAQRPDVVVAELKLAECHNAQAAASPTHLETAQVLFEHLRDRKNAPPDVKVEAGYNLGDLLERRGKLDDAARVWWGDVVYPFLRDDPNPIEAGAKRPYWLTRTLVRLGELLERQGKIDEAKQAYLLVVQKKLPYAAPAKAALQRLGVTRSL
jgi:cellulose synthase operon protein C